MGEFLNLCLEIIGSMALFHSETKIIFKIRVDKPLDTFCETCSISQERFHIGSKKDRSFLIHRFYFSQERNMKIVESIKVQRCN